MSITDCEHRQLKINLAASVGCEMAGTPPLFHAHANVLHPPLAKLRRICMPQHMRMCADLTAWCSRLQTVTKADFPLPTLGPYLESVRDEVVSGRGFALIRGVPVER